mmetsp:Transcript_12688/g.27338  ORF Transcript_12688/g.27338 Transcript_12688/m.27338 type:complete len:220 (-) Transcript_12688:427-1086(-)
MLPPPRPVPRPPPLTPVPAPPRTISSSPRSDKMAVATSISSGVVIFKLVYSPNVNFTGSPNASMIETSSVTSNPSRSTLANPRKSASTLTTCGVCTSHNLARGIVRWTVMPSSLSLMVALHGTPNTAAPTVCASVTTSKISGMVTKGRAESCTAMNSQLSASSTNLFNPFSTLPCRSTPGLANASFPPYASTMYWYSGWYLGSSTNTTCAGGVNPLAAQ